MNRRSKERPGIGRLAFCMALLFVGLTSVSLSNAQNSEKASVGKVGSRAEFDVLARTYDPDTPYALPHVLFVIDRQKGNRIYFVNTRRYKFHKDFINGTYLSLEKGREFFENNYINPNRRFILGTVAFQTPIRKWTFEFWEGDLILSEQIELTSRIINANFFEPVAFKPNSLRQDEASAALSGVARVLQNEISKEQAYEPLNINKGLGRIHIIEKMDDHIEIGFNEILVLKEVPVSLPPVAGIITTTPSTPLSHINLLAKSWGIPNAYIKNADQLFREFDSHWVSFETRRDSYSIKLADNSQLDEYQKRLAARLDLMRPRFDLKIRKLADLSQQRAGSVLSYGAKSANLGEVMNARLQGISVPNGFTIPFYYYDRFVRENGFDALILAMLDDQKFVHDPSYRRERLKELRDRIRAGKFDSQLSIELVAKVKREFPDKGLFVRSSTNSEDLPNFNGAGLYTTVPNVKGEQNLVDAIKTVWASVWNFEAYEARERAGIDHTRVFMAVLIQEGINSDSSGVMITTDPYNSGKAGTIYISAKRGLGIKVVEGEKIAEQILFRPQTNAVQVLTRSAEDSLLTFDDNGGVKEVPTSGDRAVLTDEVIRRLIRAGTGIKRIFRNRDQDIEWAYQRGRIYIVQSRPYISGS